VPINQINPCAGYRNMMLFIADRQGQATVPMPSYYTAQLLTGAWTQPGGGRHRIVPTAIAAMPGDEVRAYTVRRPDGRLAVLAINRRPRDSFRLALTMRDAQGRQHALTGPARLLSYGPDQYAWHDAGRATAAQPAAGPGGAAKRAADGELAAGDGGRGAGRTRALERFPSLRMCPSGSKTL